jgi:hypothetical protein
MGVCGPCRRKRQRGTARSEDRPLQEGAVQRCRHARSGRADDLTTLIGSTARIEPGIDWIDCVPTVRRVVADMTAHKNPCASARRGQKIRRSDFRRPERPAGIGQADAPSTVMARANADHTPDNSYTFARSAHRSQPRSETDNLSSRVGYITLTRLGLADNGKKRTFAVRSSMASLSVPPNERTRVRKPRTDTRQEVKNARQNLIFAPS